MLAGIFSHFLEHNLEFIALALAVESEEKGIEDVTIFFSPSE